MKTKKKIKPVAAIAIGYVDGRGWLSVNELVKIANAEPEIKGVDSPEVSRTVEVVADFFENCEGLMETTTIDKGWYLGLASFLQTRRIALEAINLDVINAAYRLYRRSDAYDERKIPSYSVPNPITSSEDFRPTQQFLFQENSTMKASRDSLVKLFTAMDYDTANKWTRPRWIKKFGDLTKVTGEDGAKIDQEKLDKDDKKLLKTLLKAIADEEEIEIVGKCPDDKEEAAEKPAKKSKTKKVEKEEEADDEEEDESEEEEADDEEEEEEEKPAKKKSKKPTKEEKPAKKKSKKEEPEEEDDEEEEEEEEEEKPAKKKAAGKTPVKAPGKKGVGIVATIIAEFSKGTEKKPKTVDDVHAVLVKKFGPGTETNKDVKGMRSTVSGAKSWMRTEKGLNVRVNDKGIWIEPAKEK